MSFVASRIINISIPLERINAIYIIFVVILCYTIGVPEIAKGFLAIPLYLTIPFVLGKLCARILKKKYNNCAEIIEKFDTISYWIFLWGLGIIAMISIALIFNIAGGFIYSIYLMIAAILMTAFLTDSQIKNDHEFKISSGQNTVIFLVAIIGLIVALYVSQYAPYPLMAESDQFRHDLFTVNMVEDNSLHYFESYIPTFHVLLSFPLILLNSYSDSYSFFWVVRFLLYPLYSIGIYLFSYQISKSIQLSMLAVFISSFIAVDGFDRYIFAPKGVIYVLVPFLFYFIDKNLVNNLCHKKDYHKLLAFIAVTSTGLFSLIYTYQKMYFATEYSKLFLATTVPIFILSSFYLTVSNKITLDRIVRLNSFVFLCVLLLLLLIHTQMGMSVAFFIFIYIVASIGLKEYRRQTYIAVVFAILISFIFIIVQKYGFLMFSTSINMVGIQSPVDDTDFSYKYKLIERIFSEFVLTIFGFGIVYTILYRSVKNIPLMLTGASVFFVYFIPIPFIYRIMITATPIISYFAAYAIIKCRYIIIGKYKNILYFTLLIIILTPAIMNPYSTPIEWFKTQEGANYFSFYEPYEYETAKWIQNNISVADTYVLSDPFTHYLITGIANTNEIIGMAGNLEGQHDAVADILSTNNSNDLANKIDKFMQNGWYVYRGYRFNQSGFNPDKYRNMNVLVVVTGRTQFWLEQRKSGQVYVENLAHNFNDMEYLDKFNNSKFSLIYKADGKMYVYQLNRE